MMPLEEADTSLEGRNIQDAAAVASHTGQGQGRAPDEGQRAHTAADYQAVRG